MDRVKQNDQKAFERLYNKYKAPILSYLYFLTQSKNVSDELAQETFLRVYRARHSYDAQTAKFTTWLWTIARNLAYDQLRKKKEHLFKIEDDKDPFENIEQDSPSAEALLINYAKRKTLESCFNELTLGQREALALRTFQELSYGEIGLQMSLTLTSVRALIFRARKKLIECIRNGGHIG